MFFREKLSEAAPKIAISRAPAASAASNPFMLGTSTGKLTSSRFGSAASTAAVSAICGTHFGETKLPASIDLRPAASSFSMSATLVAVGSVACSFCSPSRGPTSHMRTSRGSVIARLLERDQLGALLDQVAGAVVDAGEDAGLGRRDRVLHLHRLEHHQRLAALDLRP